jgi:hypothetical protein
LLFIQIWKTGITGKIMKKATVQDTVTEYLEQLYTNLSEHGFHDAGIPSVILAGGLFVLTIVAVLYGCGIIG